MEKKQLSTLAYKPFLIFGLILVSAFLFAQPAAAAISFNATSTGHQGGTSGSLTYSHTISGSDNILLIFATCFYDYSSNCFSLNTDSGAYFDGVKATFLDLNNAGGFEVRPIWVWAVLNPTLGTHDVLINEDGFAYPIDSSAISYSGVDTNNLPATSSSYTINSSSVFNTNITTAANSWVVGFNLNSPGGGDMGANTTLRYLEPNYTGLQMIEFSGNPISSIGYAATTSVVNIPTNPAWSNLITGFVLNPAGGGPPSPGIDLINPGSTDFANWEVSSTWSSTSTSPNVIEISYGPTSTPFAYHDFYSAPANTLSFYSEFLISKSQLLTNGTYYAQATQNFVVYVPPVCPGPGPCYGPPESITTTTATSSIISFTITAPFVPGGGYIPPPTSTTSSANFVLTCDSTSGFFSYSLCSIFQYLFVPQTSDLTRFSSLYAAISNKPPFGYLGSVSSAMNSLSTASTTTFGLVDLSSLGGLWSPIQAILGTLLWILFAFWLFDRVRHFQF